MQIWSISGTLAAASDHTIGGLLGGTSWRWIFLLNLHVGIIATIAGRPHPGPAQRTDPRRGGRGTRTGPGQGTRLGLELPRRHHLPGCRRVRLAAFVLRPARPAVPFVDLHLFRYRIFTAANIAALPFYASFTALLLA